MTQKKCIKCGAILNSYNESKLCNPCSKKWKLEIPDIAIVLLEDNPTRANLENVAEVLRKMNKDLLKEIASEDKKILSSVKKRVSRKHME